MSCARWNVGTRNATRTTIRPSELGGARLVAVEQTDETRDFDLGDILSITTGKLVSRDHIGGVYRILNFMTGDELFTHQLPRASRECGGPLLAQHPDLAAIVVPATVDSEEAVNAFLDSLIPVYGRTRAVTALDAADHTQIDALEELGLIGIDPERVIPVVLPDSRARGAS